ncbi:hypothetical protein B0A55_03936 [Friedmanniomyces simplex]|uniref:Uncharacterized protein n=1 Tax=Friedmanniomyces simplex TaxID=329884 RepID=A0A4U0XMD2_9PEZI|nr:hypothetical protein B0A55_03936 [Friedmanniomyces simplex]
MSTSRSTSKVVLRITRYMQLLISTGLAVTTAYYTVAAFLADFHPHGALYSLFVNTWITVSATLFNFLAVAELREVEYKPITLFKIECSKAWVATSLGVFCMNHLPSLLNMEEPIQMERQSLIGGSLLLMVFYLPLALRYRESRCPPALDTMVVEKSGAGV